MTLGQMLTEPLVSLNPKNEVTSRRPTVIQMRYSSLRDALILTTPLDVQVVKVRCLGLGGWMGMFNGERYEMLYPDGRGDYGDNQGTCDYTFRCMNEQDAYLLESCL